MRAFTAAASVLALTAAVACTDADSNAARGTGDSSVPSMADSIAPSVVDTALVDTSSTTAIPAVPTPPDNRRQVTGDRRRPAPPIDYGPVIGEGRRETPLPPDPPPNVIGETRREGGTMAPLPPLRDSSFGPRARIDETGKRVPIKR